MGRIVPRARLAWLLWALVVTVAALGLFLFSRTWSVPTSNQWGLRGFDVIHAWTFATVGVLIAARRPENAIGWIFLVAALCLALQFATGEYAAYALRIRDGELPAGALAAWMATWVWIPFVALVGSFLFLLFPDGRFLSPRWRVVAGAVSLGAATTILAFALFPGPLQDTPFVDNPFGIAGAAELLNLLRWVGISIVFLCTLPSVSALLIRLRRAQGDERQQLKWVASASAVAAVAITIMLTQIGNKPAEILLQVVLLLIPLAAGIAILKHGLYEIDLLIYRALLYSTLTAVLAGLYTASIALSQRLFVAVTGERSDAAVVMTTLIVAAAFTPAKGRLQTILDKRLKEVHDPGRELGALNTQVETVTQVLDGAQLARRLLERAVSSFGARGGAVYLGEAESSTLVGTTGDWDGDAELRLPLHHDGLTVGFLALGPRAGGAPYRTEHLRLLETSTSVATYAILLVQRSVPHQPVARETNEYRSRDGGPAGVAFVDARQAER